MDKWSSIGFNHFCSTSIVLVLWMATWTNFVSAGSVHFVSSVMTMKYCYSRDYKFVHQFTMYFLRSTVMNAHALTLHWHIDINTLKCINYSECSETQINNECTYLEHLSRALYKLPEVRLGLSRQQNRMDPWSTDGRDGKKSMQLSHTESTLQKWSKV